MNNIFYLLPILFIFNTIFYLKNRLYLYYLIVLIYFFWCLFGIILTDDITFIILSSIWFTKFIIFHINKKAYMGYNYLYPYMQIILMLYILYAKFLQMMLGYDNKHSLILSIIESLCDIIKRFILFSLQKLLFIESLYFWQLTFSSPPNLLTF